MTNVVLEKHYGAPGFKKQLTAKLLELIEKRNVNHLPVRVICIGFDGAIGDLIGPYVGTLLKKRKGLNVPIVGSLDDILARRRLKEMNIAAFLEGYFNIVVDACYYMEEASKNTISLWDSPCRPADGCFGDVGDLCISCRLVDDKLSKSVGKLEAMHSVRFGAVYEMAKVVEIALYNAIKIYGEDKK